MDKILNDYKILGDYFAELKCDDVRKLEDDEIEILQDTMSFFMELSELNKNDISKNFDIIERVENVKVKLKKIRKKYLKTI